MWQIKNGTPAFKSVNSIDLHNNLKKLSSPGLGKDKPVSAFVMMLVAYA